MLGDCSSKKMIQWTGQFWTIQNFLHFETLVFFTMHAFFQLKMHNCTKQYNDSTTQNTFYVKYFCIDIRCVYVHLCRLFLK